MKNIFLYTVLFLLISSNCFSRITTDYYEINNTILSLGLPLEDFDTAWQFCKPHWSNTYTEEEVKDSAFLQNGKKAGFFAVESIKGQVNIYPGDTCLALLDYYYEGKQSSLIIDFIKKDLNIVKEYGYSSIDLFLYPIGFQGNFSTYNWNEADIAFLKKSIKRFKSKEVLKITEKTKTYGYEKIDGEFTEIEVDPYQTYHLAPTEKFKEAHKLLR